MDNNCIITLNYDTYIPTQLHRNFYIYRNVIYTNDWSFGSFAPIKRRLNPGSVCHLR